MEITPCFFHSVMICEWGDGVVFFENTLKKFVQGELHLKSVGEFVIRRLWREK